MCNHMFRSLSVFLSAGILMILAACMPPPAQPPTKTTDLAFFSTEVEKNSKAQKTLEVIKEVLSAAWKDFPLGGVIERRIMRTHPKTVPPPDDDDDDD